MSRTFNKVTGSAKGQLTRSLRRCQEAVDKVIDENVMEQLTKSLWKMWRGS